MQPRDHSHLLIDVLGHARAVLADIQGSAERWNAPLDPYLTLKDHVLVETSRLLLVSARLENEDVVAELVETAQLCRDVVVADGRYLARVRRFPRLAVPFSLLLLGLRACGAPVRQHEREVFPALCTTAVECTERVPFRLLELLWLRSLLGFDGSRDTAVAAFSSIGAVPHPFYSVERDACALSHAVMFVTDFGQRQRTELLSSRLEPAMLDRWLIWCLSSDNFDILGEFLIAAITLYPDRMTQTQQVCAKYLCAIWERLGFLPGPTFARRAFDALAVELQHSYVLKHTYHTMYTAGIFCSLAAATSAHRSTAATRTRTFYSMDADNLGAVLGWANQDGDLATVERAPSATAPRASFARYLERIAPESVRHSIRRVAPLLEDELDEAARDAFLGDIVLCAVIRRYALDSLLELLDGWCEHEVAITPLFVDAIAYAIAQRVGGASAIAPPYHSAAQPFEDRPRDAHAARDHRAVLGRATRRVRGYVRAELNRGHIVGESPGASAAPAVAMHRG